MRAVVAEWTERREGKGSRHNNVARRPLATGLHWWYIVVGLHEGRKPSVTVCIAI